MYKTEKYSYEIVVTSCFCKAMTRLCVARMKKENLSGCGKSTDESKGGHR